MKNKKQIENCLKSELGNLLSDFENNTLSKRDILNYFSVMLRDAEVDSRIVVNVLEDIIFGEDGKDEALSIKINEGW